MSWLLRTSLLLMVVMLVILASPKMVCSQGVSYLGYLTDQFGDPLVGGAVVVGTFDPNFDPFEYTCFYGDSICNLNGGAFFNAVSDGNFVPIHTTISIAGGLFVGSGLASVPEGEPLWLFAFEDASFNSLYQVLASSTDPAWQVPASGQSTFIHAANANLFEMGMSGPNGVQLSVIPIPEPSSSVLCLMSAACCLRRNR